MIQLFGKGIRRWVAKLLRLLKGPNIVFQTKRGKIDHQYTFQPIDGRVRAVCIKNPFSDCTRIRYHLTQYNGGADAVTIKLIEDNLHELAHWAVDDNSNYMNDGGDHSKEWKEVLYPVIEYVHPEVEISGY